MSDLLMGMDLGTTRVKAVVHTPDGVPVASASVPTPWRHDGVGMQLDALALRDVVLDVAGRAADQALQTGAGRIAAIGVTGMGEAGVLTGPDGAPLAPVRAWHDARGDLATLEKEVGEAGFRRAIGMPLTAQPSLPKILALRDEFPDSAAAQRFWSVPEWAVRCLGGDPGSELSLASRTGLMDVVSVAPWSIAVDLLGRDLLGDLQPAGTDCGRAGGDVPEALRGAVLAVGGHDHQTAAYAVGAARDGLLLDSVGTAEALLRFTAGPIEADVVERLAGQGMTVGRTVVHGHWCILAGWLIGLGLERICAALGVTGRVERARLGEAAVAVGDLPGTAHVAMDGDTVVLRLDADVEPARLWARAVHDLVGQADAPLDRMRAALGPEGEVIATGGWLGNPAVLAAKRRQFPGLALTTTPEAGAAGAARLAGEAAGLLVPDPRTAWGPPPPDDDVPQRHREDVAPQRETTREVSK